ncbi:hypothetical protein BP6252_03800 [Coleophoma cylindrospora]|uniref:Uncharacterized protein n=1 Tax=Coleophoma cylindrospora TaxID=1849047 RepID=A0A3D8SA58_9HELO|nr:hypothetical protein BP6252_03800 [Coleophoma cylindrospora]
MKLSTLAAALAVFSVQAVLAAPTAQPDANAAAPAEKRQYKDDSFLYFEDYVESKKDKRQYKDDSFLYFEDYVESKKDK